MLYILTYNNCFCQYIISLRRAAMDDKLIIRRKNLKGEDGYKTFSIRIKDDTFVKLNELSDRTNRSRNELVNILLEFAINNCTVK